MDDIDALKDEISQLEKELKKTKAVTQQYLQNVAHQLTAPLGAIKWSIEAIKDKRVPLSRKKTLLSSVYSQATILVHLIKNFTLMSNLETDHELGQFREKPEPQDAMRLAINLVNDFQPQAYEQGIRIAVDNESFQKVFGSNDLLIEKNLVAQAISNTLENAVKYADRDSKIDVTACSSSDHIGIAIESFGIPISEADTQGVFERGFRGFAAQQKVAAGTGFGLYLAARIMAFHEGTIKLIVQGKRSQFLLMFPESRLAKRR